MELLFKNAQCISTAIVKKFKVSKLKTSCNVLKINGKSINELCIGIRGWYNKDVKGYYLDSDQVKEIKKLVELEAIGYELYRVEFTNDSVMVKLHLRPIEININK